MDVCVCVYDGGSGRVVHKHQKITTICGVVSEKTLLSKERLQLTHYLQLPLASKSPQLST